MNNADWWARQLGTPTQRQVNLPPPPPSTLPMTPAVPTQQSRPLLTSQQSSSCPSCGSPNYGGTLETRPRCYDCGYPLVQSGSGVGTVQSSNGPATPAKQVASGGFNPTTIVGKL